MLRAKTIEEWSLTLVCNDSHRYEEAYFAMPALKAGRYLLMVSPSEAANGKVTRSFSLSSVSSST